MFSKSLSRGLYISLYVIKELDPKKYEDTVRIGLAVGKKVGNAVQRNKIKRRLRVLARAVIVTLENLGYYYMIVTHKNVTQASYQDLKKDLIICLEKFY